MTSTTPTKPRRHFANVGDRRCVIPAGARTVPDEVRQASDAVVEGHHRVDAADRDGRAALAELEQAKAADVAADRAASAAGKPLPTKRAEASAQAACALARRRLDAEIAAREEAGFRFAKAIADNYAEWEPRLTKAVEDGKAEALEHLSAAIDAIDRAQEEGYVLEGLEQTRDSGNLRGVVFGTSAEVAKRRTKAFQKQREAITLGGTGSLTVARDLDQLLAALVLEITGTDKPEPIRSRVKDESEGGAFW